MKQFFSLLFLFVLVSGLSLAQDFSVNPNLPSKSFGQIQYANIDATTITHSVDPVTVTALTGVSCTTGGITSDNQYWRAFVLADFGITDDFAVTMVEFGIETATGGGGSGVQPMTVNLYTTNLVFPTGTLTLIGTLAVMVPDQALSLYQIPVTGTAPAGSELVVEISIPADVGAGNVFYPGANSLGETADSWISSAGCGLATPVTYTSIGFPTCQLVMSVTGETGGGSGTTFFDDFEAYVAGQQVACQNPTDWSTWTIAPCGNEDALVSTNFAFSGSNSALIDVVTPRAVDLVKPHGGLTTGTWYIDFMVYIPTGKFGYFNTMAEWATLNYQWAFQAFFNAGGTGTLDAGAASAATFTFPHNTWFPVSAVIDLDLDLAELWINNTFVYSWQYTLGTFGTPVPKVIDANDFFGPDGVAANNEMYLDDYRFADNPIVPVELTSFTGNVNNLGQVLLNWETASELNNQGFEIERRTESSEFRTIGFVEGNGTTTEPRSYNYLDKTVEQGINYYRLKQVDFDGTYSYSDEVEVDVTAAPLTFDLAQNYPNPFNPSTNIKFSVPESGNVKLSVYNLVGEEVAVLVNGFSQAGFFEVTFDASNLSSGVYLYKLQSANSVQTMKMMLLK